MAHVVADGEPKLAFACIDGTIARAPKGGWCTAEQTDGLSLRFNRTTSGNTQALGRSRGGFGSKIVGVCDMAGRLVDFVLVPGQATAT